MRWFSSIMFALMAMALPVAGVQYYFCTTSMAFVESADDCPTASDVCCGIDDEGELSAPDCMIASKTLPDAEKSSPLQLPSMVIHEVFLPFLPDVFARTEQALTAAGSSREPPEGPRLYLLQRSLLI